MTTNHMYPDAPIQKHHYQIPAVGYSPSWVTVVTVDGRPVHRSPVRSERFKATNRANAWIRSQGGEDAILNAPEVKMQERVHFANHDWILTLADGEGVVRRATDRFIAEQVPGAVRFLGSHPDFRIEPIFPQGDLEVAHGTLGEREQAAMLTLWGGLRDMVGCMGADGARQWMHQVLQASGWEPYPEEDARDPETAWNDAQSDVRMYAERAHRYAREARQAYCAGLDENVEDYLDLHGTAVRGYWVAAMQVGCFHPYPLTGVREFVDAWLRHSPAGPLRLEAAVWLMRNLCQTLGVWQQMVDLD